MLVEAYHNRFKTFYMQRKKNKRIDDLFNILLTIEADDYLRRKRDITYCSPDPILCSSRHKRGIAIPNDFVQEEDASTWKVKAADDPAKYYDVCKRSDICVEDFCFNKCLELACIGLCEHTYSCTCPDRSGICKHIHKVHSLWIRAQHIRTISHDCEIPATEKDNDECLLFVQDPRCSTDSPTESLISYKLSRIKDSLKKIGNLLEDECDTLLHYSYRYSVARLSHLMQQYLHQNYSSYVI